MSAPSRTDYTQHLLGKVNLGVIEVKIVMMAAPSYYSGGTIILVADELHHSVFISPIRFSSCLIRWVSKACIHLDPFTSYTGGTS